MRAFFIVAAMSAAPLAASPVSASNPDTVSRTVSFSDIDLTSRDGQREMRKRVGQAITDVCGNYPVAARTEEVDRLNACRKAAQMDASRQLAGRQTNTVVASSATR